DDEDSGRDERDSDERDSDERDSDGRDNGDTDGRTGRSPAPPETRNVLYAGAQEPPNGDTTTAVISGYRTRIPASWDRRLRSKENPRSVTLYVDNWYGRTVEIFQIQENGRPRGIGRPESYTSLQVDTRQGNVFVFYGVDGTYFGHFSTTGESRQRVRLEE
ncbi:MAG: hypothetical protein ACOC2Y_08180, partial [Spirochaetota bacterium]